MGSCDGEGSTEFLPCASMLIAGHNAAPAGRQCQVAAVMCATTPGSHSAICNGGP